MRVTLRDIADEAGMSMMTVSNVINGKQAPVSSPETVEPTQRIVWPGTRPADGRIDLDEGDVVAGEQVDGRR